MSTPDTGPDTGDTRPGSTADGLPTRPAAGSGEPPATTLAPELVAVLRQQLPEVAGHTIEAVTREVPSYGGAFAGALGDRIENAVQMALAGFFRIASRRHGDGDPGSPRSPALKGAYDLGRGEARSGRSVDALLSAYRVGARVAWRELAQTAVARGVPADTVAEFAESVFAYIDELSAASVAGHSDELSRTGRLRERHLERLALALVSGAPADALVAAAERADWRPPRRLTAVLLPAAQVRPAVAAMDPRTLVLSEDLPDLEPAAELAALLVPDAHPGSRGQLLTQLVAKGAVVGPSRPWLETRTSYARAVRARSLDGLRTAADRGAPVDTEERLAELVLGADPEALADLRARVLAPLNALKPSAREKLADTLRSWLLHQGRREDVAGDLFVHPQTVRYRVGQLRELFGDGLQDPRTVLELTVALGVGVPSSGDPPH